MIILHSSLDGFSRKFVEAHGEGMEIVNWYEDEAGRAAYLAQGYPSPSAFPTVVDKVKKKALRRPLDWAEVKLWKYSIDKTTAETTFDAAIAAGFPVEGKDYSLSLKKEARELFSQMLSLVQEKNSQNPGNDNSEVSFKDKEGVKRNITINKYRKMVMAYLEYYKSLIDTADLSKL